MKPTGTAKFATLNILPTLGNRSNDHMVGSRHHLISSLVFLDKVLYLKCPVQLALESGGMVNGRNYDYSHISVQYSNEAYVERHLVCPDHTSLFEINHLRLNFTWPHMNCLNKMSQHMSVDHTFFLITAMSKLSSCLCPSLIVLGRSFFHATSLSTCN